MRVEGVQGASGRKRKLAPHVPRKIIVLDSDAEGGDGGEAPVKRPRTVVSPKAPARVRGKPEAAASGLGKATSACAATPLERVPATETQRAAPPAAPTSQRKPTKKKQVVATVVVASSRGPPAPRPPPLPASEKKEGPQRRTDKTSGAPETLPEQLQRKQRLRMEWEATKVKRRGKRRVIDPLIRTLGCWASTRGIKLPPKCLPIPPYASSPTCAAVAPAHGDGDGDDDDDDDDDDEAPIKVGDHRGDEGDGDGDGEAEGEENAQGHGKPEKEKQVVKPEATRNPHTPAPGDRRTPKRRKREGTDAAAEEQEEEMRSRAKRSRPETTEIRDVGSGTLGFCGGDRGGGGEADSGDARAEAGRWRRQPDELCILSIDFGIVLTFVVLLVSNVSLRIVQWQSVRLSENKVKCQEAALALVAYLCGFMEGPPDFDVVLLEDQPPKKATRTRDLSYATYGMFETMYRSVPPDHPRHARHKGMPHIAFVHAQLKINLCYLMGVESSKSELAAHYNHNKDISTVGCKHLLMHLAPFATWAAPCLRWLLNQTKMDDYADALLQALAWYHARPGLRLPYDIVPVNSHTTVAPPSAATIARRLQRPPGAPPARTRVPLAVTLGKRRAKLRVKESVGRLSTSDY